MNTHAESGRNAGDKMRRDKQLQYMQRLGDREIQNKSLDSDIMILAGDLNVGEGEDRCLVRADWRDAWLEAKKNDKEAQGQQWTWCRGTVCGRYDRVYVKSIGSVSVACVRAKRLKSVWPKLTDHVGLHVVLRRQPSERNAIQIDEKPSTDQLREDIRIIEINNRIVEFDNLFEERAAKCLAHVENLAWSPADVPQASDDHVLD